MLLLLAVLTRIVVLGSPFIYADEEFYLFVGGQMLHGALPFVDIWDRKPVGLFLLYAFFHLFGPWRIYAYQIAALLSAWWTACLVFSIARKMAPYWGALLAGGLYLLWVIGVHGEGGQSSIFYTSLVCLAVWLIVSRLPDLMLQRRLRSTGFGVMALLGLSMQIKYTTLFEGVYLGCFLLWLGWQAGRPFGKLCVDGLLWAGMALLPTISVILVYVALGHGDAWWFANMRSMFLRHTEIDVHNLKWFFFISFLLLAGALWSWFYRPQQKGLPCLVYGFLLGWALSAYLGYCALREFPKHYSIPLFAPFFVLVALLWQRRLGQLWLGCLVVLGIVRGYAAERKDLHGPDGRVLKQVQVAVSSPPGCSFMFTGQSIILDMIPYCHLSAYPFPAHLSFEDEKDALGMDPMMELRHILEQKPLYLLDSHSEDHSEENEATRALFNDYVRRFYVQIYEHDVNDTEQDIIVYRRKAGE